MRFFNSAPSFRKFAGIAAALMILPVAVACDTQVAEDAIDPTAETMPEADEAEIVAGETIVDVAAANGSFDTLVAAIQAADLVETLSAEGPYTVFAPTDEAFAALPEGVLNKLLLPENKDVLTQILTYHVVEGAVMSSDIVSGTASTVGGQEVTVTAADGSVMINEATVVQADVVASNGVIHVIDAVLLPPDVDPAAL